MLNKSTSGGKSAENVTSVLGFSLQHLAVGSRTQAEISVSLFLCLFCNSFCGTGIGSRVENFSKVSPSRFASSNFRLEHRESPTKHSSYLACQTCLTVQNQYICMSLITLFNKAAFPGLADLHNILKTNLYISGRKHSPAD